MSEVLMVLVVVGICFVIVGIVLNSMSQDNGLVDSSSHQTTRADRKTRRYYS